ncbi:MAG: DUF1553 domain-containing protein [Acidimicrobiia bacterium]|nr:DUF1553 domain-containing protein [Acidimicrobiia bacterium]
MMRFRSSGPCAATLLLGFSSGLSLLTAADCSLRPEQDKRLAREAQARLRLYEAASKFNARQASAHGLPAAEIPRRNFIDEEIFGKLQSLGLPSASLTTDGEFVRRIYFDLTGHPPSPEDIRSFLNDSNPGKRRELIDKLLYSKEFVDKWTLWLGDLLMNVAFPQNFDRQYFARNAYYEWMKLAIANEKSLKEIAFESIAATGNSYDNWNGGTNFILNGIVAMGPIQDRYDNMMRVSTTTFLGLSHYDCLLCHDGRRRLDQVSLWGSRMTRLEAQRMAAFFARTNLAKPSLPTTEYYYNSYNITDRTTGNYDLNTNFGNRPDRLPIGEMRFLTPEYRDGAKPADGNWRAAFAASMVHDPLFPINMANRFWKEFFGLALIDPEDSIDPARLDPANPPPAPWALQASHPELILKLADAFVEGDYNLREFLRILVESSAYQLSSRYEAEWNITHLPLFARHYPRRLEGEEIHDAIVKASGMRTMYTIRGLDDTPWAMQMPEPVEPRSNGSSTNFMIAFFRGNRDSQFRIQDGSIQQQLNLMNDPFVLNRIRLTNSANMRAVAAITDDAAAVEELFLLFLNRKPDSRELKIAADFLSRAGNQRNTYLEDLAWVLINKTDFLFNY